MSMERYISHSQTETEQLGERFGSTLARGDTVALTGELGAGKTAFTRGIARALGCTGEVTSPTFAIMRLLEGTIPLAHFDVYRVEPDELYNTGFFDYAGGDCVTVVEWSDIIADMLSGSVIAVNIVRLDDTAREITAERCEI